MQKLDETRMQKLDGHECLPGLSPPSIIYLCALPAQVPWINQAFLVGLPGGIQPAATAGFSLCNKPATAHRHTIPVGPRNFRIDLRHADQR